MMIVCEIVVIASSAIVSVKCYKQQEAQLSLRDHATWACQLKSWQLLNDYTIHLMNTDCVSVSASRLTLRSIHIATTEMNCTDKLARL